MALAMDFRSTLDGLSWVPKLHRERTTRGSSNRTQHGFRKVQSEPAFVKLPAIAATRQLQHHDDTNSARTGRTSPRLSPDGARWLLRGVSTEVGQRNAPPKLLALAPPQEEPPRPRHAADDVVGHQAAQPPQQPQQHHRHSITKSSNEFQESVRVIFESITGIHSSMDRFEGGQPAEKETFVANEIKVEISEQDAKKSRLKQYRYVRKLSTPLISLPNPEDTLLQEFEAEQDFDARPNHAVLRNMSSEYIQRFSPEGRRLDLAQRVGHRNRQLNAAKDRRSEHESKELTRKLQDVRFYESRMASFDKDRFTTSRRKVPVGSFQTLRIKQEQTSRWLTILHIARMMQVVGRIVVKYREVSDEFMNNLEKEHFFLRDESSSQREVATVMGKHLIRTRFAEAARVAVRHEWRFKTDANTGSIWNSGPTAPESLRRLSRELQPIDIVNKEIRHKMQHSALLQVTLVAKVLKRRHNVQARIVTGCLTRWQRGTPLTYMINYVRAVKRIQRFVRWSLQRLAMLHATTEALWERLEHAMVMAEATAAGVTLKLGSHAAEAVGVRARRRSIVKENHHYRRRSSGVGLRRPSIERPQSPELVCTEKRHVFLVHELRARRIRTLHDTQVWLVDMDKYNHDVQEWRMHMQACKLLGLKREVPMPQMPPCPTQMPSEQEVTEMIRRARGMDEPLHAMKKTTWQSKRSQQRPVPSSQDAFVAGEVRGSTPYCNQVGQLMAVPPYKPSSNDHAHAVS